MAQEVGSIYAKVDADLGGFNKGMKSVDRQLNQTSGKVRSGFGMMGKAAAIGGLAIAAGLGYGLKKAIQSANEHALALAQTEAAVKSTGGAANVTAKQILKFADAMEKKTGVDDLAIQRGQNLLLTFTNIHNEVGKGKDIFNQASVAVTDMSVALGQDAKASAIQLGKALNDPVKGISALSRVGVAFTADQKEMIKGMVAAGDVMGAQKVILAELTKEFGGSAEAAGKTLPGQLNILKAHLDDVAQKIGEKLVPALTSAVTYVSAHWGEISATAGRVFAAISAAAEPIVTSFKTNWPQIKAVAMDVFNSVREVVERVFRAVGPFVLTTVKGIAAGIRLHWGEIKQTVHNVMVAVEAVVTRVWPIVKTLIVTTVKVIGDTIRIVMALIRGDWGAAWGALKDLARDALTGVLTAVKQILTTLASVVWSLAKAVGRALVQGILDGLSGLGSAIKNKIEGTLSSVLHSINIPGLSPPAHAAAEAIGKPLGQGVIRGWIDGTVDLPQKMSDSLSAAIDRARGAIDAKRSSLSAAWSRLSGDALSAFDGIASVMKTKSEKLLAQMDMKEQLARLHQNLLDAKAALTEALAADDPAAKLAALRGVQDAENAILRDGLERQAAQERLQLDARNDYRRRHFEDALSALEKSMAKEGVSAGAAHKAILKLFDRFGVDFQASGAAQGSAFVKGLKESLEGAAAGSGALQGTITAAARSINFRPGGVQGIPELASGGEILQSGIAVVHKNETVVPAGKTGGGQTVNLVVNMPNYLGNRREAAKELLDELASMSRDGGALFSRTVGVTV